MSIPSFAANTSCHRHGEQVLVWLLRGCALLAAVVVVLIVVFIAAESWPALRQWGLMRFVSDPSWHPVEGFYNMLPMVWGTLLAVAGAILIAAPLGLLLAVFMHYYAGAALANVYRRVLEVMAGLPSVIYGFWGLVVLVPMIAAWQPPGASLLAGSLVLAMMILPTIAMVADASIAAVPRQSIHAGVALGLDRSGLIWRVVLPGARSGITVGMVLQTGRALGETMVVLMVCGNVVQVPGSVFEPVRTLTANIALEMAYAVGGHRSALFVSGLLLTVVVVLLVATAEIIQKRRRSWAS